MPKKTKISQEDLNAFYKAVQGTKPLLQRKVQIDKPKPKTMRKSPKFNDEISFFDGGEPRETVQANDYIQFKSSGVAEKILRKLRKGQYTIEAVLDLHRKTVEEARSEVNRFLTECINHGIKCVLMIHGKGKPGAAPALKNQLNYWLRQAHPVLAFCSSAPKHGGNGAIYVLLKSFNEENKLER
ncbi:MAG TPA: Smr/MutS family protein [Gammaproteobacteria bacterium]|jgi:DNA-nicking Smr family endonuclease|nr:Smr/MutS family protein [Gammaproteobacteria bacterium]